MKKTILIISLCLLCFSMYAQRNSLTVHINAGELKDSLNQEQMEIVDELIVTGSMNKDDLYLMHAKMPRLEIVNIRNVSLDTIPEKTFYENRTIKYFTLPLGIKYLGSHSFEDSSISLIITGKFPDRGDNVVEYSDKFWLSDDNEYCKFMMQIGIYSIDGEVMYCFINSDDIDIKLKEGTETIANRAFEGAYIRRLHLPASLIQIEESAFKDVKLGAIAGNKYGDSGPAYIAFDSPYPPSLAKGVFSNELSKLFYIIVPKGSRDFYKAADPQWSLFKIYEEDESVSIVSSKSKNRLSVHKQMNLWKLSNDKLISHVYVYNSMGTLIVSEAGNSSEINIPFCTSSIGVFYAKVIYSDNSFEAVKLIN